MVQHNEEEVAFIGLLGYYSAKQSLLYVLHLFEDLDFISCIKDDPKCLAMAFVLAKVYHCQNVMNSQRNFTRVPFIQGSYSHCPLKMGTKKSRIIDK